MIDALVAHFAEILFYVLAGLAIAGAVGVITFRNPVHSAVSLLGTFLVVACLFVLQHAEFVAAVQVLVYAGGIMVLFLFVMMLVNVRQVRPDSAFLSAAAPLAVMGGILLGLLVVIAVLLGAVAPAGPGPDALRTVAAGTDAAEVAGNTQAVGMEMFTRYLVPFEVVSVVLLVAMIGAIIFGRKTPDLDDPTTGGEA